MAREGIRMLRKLLLAAAFLTSSIGFADAADISGYPVADESEWSFTIAPYVWLAGLDGEIAALGAPEVDIDLSIPDVLKHFDAGFMGSAEARNGRFSIATDFFWVKLSATEDTPRQVLADKVDITAQTLMITGVGAYKGRPNLNPQFYATGWGFGWRFWRRVRP